MGVKLDGDVLPTEGLELLGEGRIQFLGQMVKQTGTAPMFLAVLVFELGQSEVKVRNDLNMIFLNRKKGPITMSLSAPPLMILRSFDSTVGQSLILTFDASKRFFSLSAAGRSSTFSLARTSVFGRRLTRRSCMACKSRG